jgi:hypothetical protein
MPTGGLDRRRYRARLRCDLHRAALVRLAVRPPRLGKLPLVEHLGSHSVLAVVAHPNDETLAAGALAAGGARSWRCARSPSREMRPGIPNRRSLDRRIPLIRESGLKRYGFALGIDHQEMGELPDGGLDSADRAIVGCSSSESESGNPISCLPSILAAGTT